MTTLPNNINNVPSGLPSGLSNGIPDIQGSINNALNGVLGNIASQAQPIVELLIYQLIFFNIAALAGILSFLILTVMVPFVLGFKFSSLFFFGYVVLISSILLYFYNFFENRVLTLTQMGDKIKDLGQIKLIMTVFNIVGWVILGILIIYRIVYRSQTI